MLVEESREIVVVLDSQGRVVTASRRARELFDGLVEGEAPPEAVLRDALAVTYSVGGADETLVYVRDPGHVAAYEELRAGFTASVSHELRTPLARLLALLESATLPDADREELIEQAQAEVRQIGELIDDVLFLSELETGRAVVALGSTRAVPVVQEVLSGLREASDRAAVMLAVEGDPATELPLRPRMLRVIVDNLANNAIRYAGPGATMTIEIAPHELVARDNGAGVAGEDLPRLFERFFRADRVRGSRGTGLGLAVVKHIVVAAGGTVEASGGLGKGLTIRCRFA
jgi:signal transduction histidine kinase